MSIKNIYIAGPLYTPAERSYLERIDKICKKCGYNTYLPHRDVGIAPASGSSTLPFFENDLIAVKNSDVVVAILNGTDVDSGTAWEIGCAYAYKKPIIGIYEDTRIDNPLAALNLMITSSAEIFKSVDDLEVKLIKLKKKLP